MQTGFVVSSLVSSHASYGPSHFPAWCVAHWKTERHLPFPKQIEGNLGDFQPCFITRSVQEESDHLGPECPQKEVE